MLGITQFPLFVAAVLLLNLTPGPDTAYIVGRSVAQGRLAGVVSALGIGAGCCVHALASAFGLTALLATSATAFTVVKIVGAVYLVYLGVRLLLARPAAREGASVAVLNSATATATAPRALRKLFVQGFWTNVLNPKVVLFFVSFFPQFVSPDSEHKVLAFLTLGAVFVAMSSIWCCFIAWVAGSVTQRFSGKPRIKKWLDRGVGSAFVGLGVKLAMSKR